MELRFIQKSCSGIFYDEIPLEISCQSSTYVVHVYGSNQSSISLQDLNYYGFPLHRNLLMHEPKKKKRLLSGRKEKTTKLSSLSRIFCIHHNKLLAFQNLKRFRSQWIITLNFRLFLFRSFR